jgi:Glycosyl transferase family 11
MGTARENQSVIVALDGGLGNQMFQYAFGRSLSIARSEEVLFYKKFSPRAPHLPQRRYMLDAFNVDVKFTDSMPEPIFYDQAFCYQPGLFRAPRGASFDGWWQTEKYFVDSFPLRWEFNLRVAASEQSARIAEMMWDRPSAFMHVRRGDYTTPEALAYHGICSLDYYREAACRINAAEKVLWFIFSDDPEWCIQNFKHATVVDWNLDKPWEDIWLMRQCWHGVISNSTFGWWGAWLGDAKENRIVIAPDKWFSGAGLNSKDVVPERWVKLAN